MAGRIRVLDELTANQIAAGEVVERPAAVVKELVENAVDAAARRVTVELRAGGVEMIRVIDDGRGIAPEDVPLATQRHATSKISKASDLESIISLGFRGEALPSIAAVSRLELVTREPEALAGRRHTVRGGKAEEPTEVGCPAGTQVTVTELFYNAPARRKTLRGPAAELDRCLRAVTALAMARPEISFKVVHNGREVLATPGSGQLVDVVHGLYGREVSEGLILVQGDEDGMRPNGFVGAPAASRANRSHQFFIVNGRPVAGFPLSFALEESFRGLLSVGRHPVCFLRLDLPPDRLDVNVHPTKTRVRFHNDSLVIRVLRRAIGDALAAADLMPRVTADPSFDGGAGVRWATAPLVREAATAYELVETGLSRERPPADLETVPDPRPVAGDSSAGRGQGGRRLPPMRLLGLIDNTYIIAAAGDGLLIIDQHAAHERLNYEHFLALRAAGAHAGQPLAVPEPVQVGQAGVAAWESQCDYMEALGFRAEPFGLDTLLLREVPLLLAGAGAVTAFRNLLDRFVDGRAGDPAVTEEELVWLASRSCKASVKAHDHLETGEIAALLEALAALENPFTCPHGRPTILNLSLGDLERLFRRA